MEEQKSPLEKIRQQRLKDFGEFVQSLLESAHEEIAETILLMMISRGLSVSEITVGLANIAAQRGCNKATKILEEASLLLQEDEP